MFDNIICVILARGGSKEVPGKNLRMLGGIPLVAHSILHAKKHIPSDCIVLSSDDSDILKCGEEYGVVPLRRPAEFATDEASSDSALIHVVKSFKSLVDIKDILFLQPTSPIRFTDTIRNFVSYYHNHEYDSCLTTSKLHNFFWKFRKGSSMPSASYNYHLRPRRQDLDDKVDYYHYDNGNAYLVKRDLLIDHKCRIGGDIGVFPISELESMQIDTLRDWSIMELIFNGEINKWTGI